MDVTIFSTACVMREIVIEGVVPVAERNARQFQIGASEIGGLLGAPILAVDAIETAVVQLNAATDVEAEVLGIRAHRQSGTDDNAQTKRKWAFWKERHNFSCEQR